mgnify:CR=1 FL=1
MVFQEHFHLVTREDNRFLIPQLNEILELTNLPSRYQYTLVLLSVPSLIQESETRLPLLTGPSGLAVITGGPGNASTIKITESLIVHNLKKKSYLIL